jgi:hypothetical protein
MILFRACGKYSTIQYEDIEDIEDQNMVNSGTVYTYIEIIQQLFVSY